MVEIEELLNTLRLKGSEAAWVVFALPILAFIAQTVIAVVTHRRSAKVLANHQSQLDLTADRLRSELERDTIDYSLWAERRHQATVNLFRALLRLQKVARSVTPPLLPYLVSTKKDIDDLIALIANSDEDRTELNRLLEEDYRERFNEVASNLIQRNTRHTYYKLQRKAWDVYNDSTLYLSNEVDEAAKQVLALFDTLIARFEGQPSLNTEPLFKYGIGRLRKASKADLARGNLDGNNLLGKFKTDQ